jgi:hypothetical protein
MAQTGLISDLYELFERIELVPSQKTNMEIYGYELENDL